MSLGCMLDTWFYYPPGCKSVAKRRGPFDSYIILDLTLNPQDYCIIYLDVVLYGGTRFGF